MLDLEPRFAEEVEADRVQFRQQVAGEVERYTTEKRIRRKGGGLFGRLSPRPVSAMQRADFSTPCAPNRTSPTASAPRKRSRGEWTNREPCTNSPGSCSTRAHSRACTSRRSMRSCAPYIATAHRSCCSTKRGHAVRCVARTVRRLPTCGRGLLTVERGRERSAAGLHR